MENQVAIDDNGIVVITTVGPQTEASINAMGDQIRELIAKLQAEHRPVRALDDITKLGPVPPAARKLVVSLGRTLQYDRLAMLGEEGSVIRIGANFLLAAMGQAGKTKYFDDREKAIEWLLES